MLTALRFPSSVTSTFRPGLSSPRAYASCNWAEKKTNTISKLQAIARENKRKFHFLPRHQNRILPRTIRPTYFALRIRSLFQSIYWNSAFVFVTSKNQLQCVFCLSVVSVCIARVYTHSVWSTSEHDTPFIRTNVICQTKLCRKWVRPFWMGTLHFNWNLASAMRVMFIDGAIEFRKRVQCMFFMWNIWLIHLFSFSAIRKVRPITKRTDSISRWYDKSSNRHYISNSIYHIIGNFLTLLSAIDIVLIRCIGVEELSKLECLLSNRSEWINLFLGCKQVDFDA